VWTILDKAIEMHKVQRSDRSQVLEAILYFAERDSTPTRRAAVERATTFVRKSMSYYLQASVVLFQSILSRNDGDFVKSETQIRNFMWRGPQPVTRRDHALEGRLHISQIENKIKCYDNDVPSFIYKWSAELPLSTLDTEVTFRLQSTAARFFQSIGDFGAARASLEQFMALNTHKPIRDNSRRLLVGRLADIYCEMEEYAKALDMLQPELDSAKGVGRSRRDFRRLLLASVESNIGLGRLDAAILVLEELKNHEPRDLNDIYDQQLHMRMVLAAARIVHLGPDREEAVHQWMFALREVQNMNILNSTAGFTAAMIYLSLAHAQLTTGDRYGGQQSWESGSEILKHEKCEFWLSTIPTIWLQKIAEEVHAMEGWSVSMMLPGGTRTITRP
jgi:tetratricopeptide (TPR) repeat protein